MTLTGEQLLQGFSEFIADWLESTTTSAGNVGGTTLIDTILGRYGDNGLIHNYFRVTSGTADNQVRRAVVPFTQATGQVNVLPAFSASIASAVTYQMHKHDPMAKWLALDKARLSVMPWVFKEVRDDTLTGDGRNSEFRIPASVEWGPEVALIEVPLSPASDWNMIQEADSYGTAAGNWAAAGGVVASDYARNNFDKLIPKTEGTCQKLIYTDAGADGTYTLTTFKTGVSASAAAGRLVEFAVWVYSTTAGPFAEILTDAGTLVTSSAHQGLGWELMRASGEVAAANVTTLTVRLRFPNLTTSAHRTVFVENRFFAFNYVPDIWDDNHPLLVERDDTLQRLWLRDVPEQGRQIRLIGKAPLTALGTSTPWSGSMEVDEKSSQILYAEAAEILFGNEVLNQPAQRDVLTRISVVKDRRKMLQKTWKYRTVPGGMNSPYRS